MVGAYEPAKSMQLFQSVHDILNKTPGIVTQILFEGF